MPTSIRFLTTAIVLFASLLLQACSSRDVTDDAVSFDIAGPVAVDVASFGGDVEIVADPSLTEARVRVERWADFGEKREEEAEASLGDIQYTASLESGPEGPVLQVRATTSHPEPHRQRAHISILLPAAENVRVVTGGEVIVMNAQGSAEIEAGDEVRYLTNWPITQPISITTQDGGIALRMRGESAGEIEAQTMDGKTRVRAKYGDLRILQHDGRRLHATLNGGENPIILRAVEGNVSISVVDDPTDAGWLIFSP